MKQKLKSINQAVLKIGIATSLLLVILIIFNLFGKIDLSSITNFSTILNNLLTPILTFAAILITFLAFYVQYQFNKKQNKIIKRQNKIVEEQHLMSIKQSFDPYFIRLLDEHTNIIGDLNLERVNTAIKKRNDENQQKIEEIKQKNVFFSFSLITKSNKTHNGISYLNEESNNFKSLSSDNLKYVSYTDQIFEHYFELLTTFCNQVFKQSVYPYSVKKIKKYRFSTNNTELISSIFSTFKNKYDYLNIFLLKYNNFLETLCVTITNKKFHSDPQKNLELKQEYLIIFFQSLQTYEYLYAYFYLCFNRMEFMELYYFSETETKYSPALLDSATTRFISSLYDLIILLRNQKNN